MILDSGGEAQWYFSQVKGTMEEEVNEGCDFDTFWTMLSFG